MKLKHKSIFIILVFTLLLSASCSVDTNNSDLSPVFEFFTHPNGGGKENYRCIYNDEKNIIEAVSNENVSYGYIDSFHYYPLEKDVLESKKLGQLNEYHCFEGIDVYLYWNWGETGNSTLVKVKNGIVKSIDLPQNQDPPSFSYYEDGKIYLTYPAYWNKDNKTKNGGYTVVDLTTDAVEYNEICFYDESIESEFNISEQFEYPINMRIFDLDYSRPRIIESDGYLYFCFGDRIPINEDSCNDYMIQKYNPKSGKIEKVRIVKYEKILDVTKTDNGLAMVCEYDIDSAIGVNTLTNKVYYTTLNNNLEQIEKVDITHDDLKGNNTLYSKIADEKIYFLINLPSQSLTEANDNIVIFYDIKTKKHKVSENSIKGLCNTVHLAIENKKIMCAH